MDSAAQPISQQVMTKKREKRIEHGMPVADESNRDEKRPQQKRRGPNIALEKIWPLNFGPSLVTLFHIYVFFWGRKASRHRVANADREAIGMV
jgi:hypothetical protein